MYIRRNEDGKVIGYRKLESKYHDEWMDPNDQEMLDFENPPETYIDLRKAAYPAIMDQMDILYHKVVVGWKKVIQDIKDKYPKPDEVTE